MTEIAPAVLATLFVWWFSTGVIFWLDGLPRRLHHFTIGVATVLLGLALWGIMETAYDLTPSGAYLSFASGLMVWAWVELTFLTGLITGPNRTPRPPGLSLSRRFRLAVGAILWHELLILGLTAVVFALSWGGENLVGAWTVAILWAMRTSTKLNLFLGVRNTYAQLLPPVLHHIASHFTRAHMNPFFPTAVAAAGVLAVVLLAAAFSAEEGSFAATAFAILGTLALLGAIEHAFLMLPLRTEMLWAWSLGERAQRDGTTATP